MSPPPRWLFLAALLLLLPSTARAGAWSRDAGSTYLKLGGGWFAGNAPFDQGARGFRSMAAELYGEVGLGRGWEIDLSSRYVANRTNAGQNSGLQDLELMGKWATVSDSEVYALTGGFRTALSPRGGEPQIGPGGTDLVLGAGYGRSFSGGWVTTDALLRSRLGTPTMGLRLRGELGGKGDLPVGAALTAELQPAWGRTEARDPDTPAPVARTLGLGGKLFGDIASGVGLTADASWLPPILNDGPGYRLGAGVTFER